ncbi:MAG TPA: hypothetical protein VF865_13720 [Acidobacteriaceae bacterium]
MMVLRTVREFDDAGHIRVSFGRARRGFGNWWRVLGPLALMAAWAALSVGVAMARDPEGPLRIPLEPMGYQSILPDFLLSGSSMLTVHFVDKDHLLITFGVRRLMKREVDPPPGDDDRTIGAFLVELPSGKVLARTEWRLHDRLQYLWSLGHGRFLLRVRDRLSVIAPMRAGNAAEAFSEQPLPVGDRHVVAILVSSNDDLLTVETTKHPVAPGASAEDLTNKDSAPVQVNFYRLISGGGDEFTVIPAGAVRARSTVAIPMTTGGFLEVLEGGKSTWLFNFDEHTGKVRELAGFDTTCFPRATFVSHGEFVAFGCRGSADRIDIAGFNLKGEEMWQQNFFDTHVSPTFAFAPAAGRFALGRTIVSGILDLESPLLSSAVTSQEVRVYQSYNGKQLFRIECSPVERAGQNFALSPDGMRIAAVRQTVVQHPATKDFEAYTTQTAAVEVYALPPLSDKDRAEVKQEEALAPADTGAKVDAALQRVSSHAKPDTAVAGNDTQAPNPAVSSGVSSPAAADPVPSQQAQQPAAATAAASETEGAPGAGTTPAGEGDPEPAGPRKPPTLYGPDEKPQQKPK